MDPPPFDEDADEPEIDEGKREIERMNEAYHDDPLGPGTVANAIDQGYLSD